MSAAEDFAACHEAHHAVMLTILGVAFGGVALLDGDPRGKGHCFAVTIPDDTLGLENTIVAILAPAVGLNSYNPAFPNLYLSSGGAGDDFALATKLIERLRTSGRLQCADPWLKRMWTPLAYFEHRTLIEVLRHQKQIEAVTRALSLHRFLSARDVFLFVFGDE